MTGRNIDRVAERRNNVSILNKENLQNKKFGYENRSTVE